MRRRSVLGTVLTGVGTMLAGCGGATVTGDVVRNETPLVLSHAYERQATPSGVRVLVEVTAENRGEEPITPDGDVPRLSCRFLDETGDTLHRSGVEPLDQISVGERATFEFQLGTDTDAVTAYELSVTWVAG